MLVESVDHNGGLRFNETIPYNDEMLSTITSTNIDIVRAAMQVFTQLGMIEVLDNGTIYMTEVQKMIGSAAGNDNAIRQQRFRDKKKAENTGALPESVTKNNASVTQAVTNNNESKRIEIDKEIDKEIEDKENIQKKTRFVAPSVDEVQAYCDERHNGIDARKFVEYYEAGGWKDAKGKPVKNWKQKIITWENHGNNRQASSSGNEFTALIEQMGGQT